MVTFDRSLNIVVKPGLPRRYYVPASAIRTIVDIDPGRRPLPTSPSQPQHLDRRRERARNPTTRNVNHPRLPRNRRVDNDNSLSVRKRQTPGTPLVCPCPNRRTCRLPSLRDTVEWPDQRLGTRIAARGAAAVLRCDHIISPRPRLGEMRRALGRPVRSWFRPDSPIACSKNTRGIGG